MERIKHGLDLVLKILTAFLFTVLVLAVVWQVFSREVLQNPSTWTEELAKYTFVWTSLIAAALVFGERGHIAVSFVVELLPRTARKIVAVFIQLVVLAFAVIVFILGGIFAAQNSWMQNLTALPLNIGEAYVVMPIAGVFIAFYAIHHMIEDIRGVGPLTVADPKGAALDEATEIMAELEEDPDLQALLHADEPKHKHDPKQNPDKQDPEA
ncbi:TRAP-type C4-dicarboxylate transport system, small permease component [Raineyella antarctica]|uniref:TRAP-type C4-dicarboxylate transport system, small permease component n=1 Tax=Raineyella antarctica TaxID=1577474 RepID=A0A1G6GCQ3_9ACTN|nr:TRAP transporter small permease [Raineyella antarctica]SDB79761.1 TRAP-type C4-dicarboxylate transport system, small permease component [Raineyella antarctica]